MLDVIQGHMAPDVANAACNAGRNVLRMVELEYKFSAERSAVRKSMPISRRIANISA